MVYTDQHPPRNPSYPGTLLSRAVVKFGELPLNRHTDLDVNGKAALLLATHAVAAGFNEPRSDICGNLELVAIMRDLLVGVSFTHNNYQEKLQEFQNFAYAMLDAREENNVPLPSKRVTALQRFLQEGPRHFDDIIAICQTEIKKHREYLKKLQPLEDRDLKQGNPIRTDNEFSQGLGQQEAWQRLIREQVLIAEGVSPDNAKWQMDIYHPYTQMNAESFRTLYRDNLALLKGILGLCQKAKADYQRVVMPVLTRSVEPGSP